MTLVRVVDVSRKRIALTMTLDARPTAAAGGNCYRPAARDECAPRRERQVEPTSAMAAAFAKLKR